MATVELGTDPSQRQGVGQRPELTSGSDEFVAMSELLVDAVHAEQLIDGFRDRRRLVERWPGFRRLEVWQDQRDPGVFRMVTWWASRDEFVSYMRSEDHDVSHARIPTGAAAPRPVRLSRFAVVAR